MTAPMPAPAAAEPTTSSWDRFLFEPQSTSVATLLRIGWGVLATIWGLTLLPDVDPLLTTGELRALYDPPVGSWNPLREIGWTGAPLACCLLLVVAGITTTVGLRTRLSSIVAVVCMLSLQRYNALIFNSGDLLLRFVGLTVALSPAGLLWSLDARRNARGRRAVGGSPLRAPWAVRLLQLQVAVGYLLSAWEKARGGTWHDGTAVPRSLRIVDVGRWSPPEWFFRQQDLMNLLTWSTLLFEVSFVFLVWNRRLRPWVLGAGVVFHLGIDLAFDVGYFSYAILLAYVAFLPPEVADRVLAALRSWAPWARRPAEAAPS